MRPTRRHALLGLFAVGAAPSARAQSFPTRPLTLIVPFPGGGSTDVMNRTLADKLKEQLGQPVVLDFKPGAGGNIGAEVAARAAPDGYTLVFISMPQIISRSMYPKLGYDLLKDFEAVGTFLETAPVLIVNPSLNVKSVRELVAAAKAQPGKIEYGTGGNGTSAHLLGELFKCDTGTDLLHVPYKGAAQAVVDLIGGRVKVMFETPASIVGHVKSGAVVALAVMGPKRLAALPDVPTIAEAGFAGLELVQFATLMTPAGAPKTTIDTLAAALAKVVAMPDVRERWATIGAEPVSMTPAASMARIAAEAKRLGEIVAAANIKPD
ncbi:MAG: tripartite tricarboxylate transporter substrate binding protein [Alphaproteobacteria bacterium]|nr:tripartite tricarboxylate transporter substrate binding protein [Alphaproteobacteria bacterium]